MIIGLMLAVAGGGFLLGMIAMLAVLDRKYLKLLDAERWEIKVTSRDGELHHWNTRLLPYTFRREPHTNDGFVELAKVEAPVTIDTIIIDGKVHKTTEKMTNVFRVWAKPEGWTEPEGRIDALVDTGTKLVR